MNRLTQKAQSHISINGNEVALKTSFRNALLTWNAMEAANLGEITPLSAACAAINNMLGLDISDIPEADISEALTGIAEYLKKYARISDMEKHDNRPPLLDLEQDATLLYDAFMSLGVDLDEQHVPYPRFMSLLRELPKDAAICRIIYLRQQHQRGKLTEEEKEEIRRRGQDVVYIRNRKAERARADNTDYFKQLQDKKRAEKGLPPL